MSAKPHVSEPLSPSTVRSYAAIWGLFVDWCDVAGHQPLPADPATVLSFLRACPAAAATGRRRVIAIDHHHTATGHPAPGADPRVRAAVGRPPTEPAAITAETQSRVDAALRALPSRGWTGGLFGQRERCLLVLSQLARIPHQQLTRLTVGDITITGGVATITRPGRSWTVEATADPVLCGPCAIVRWLDTHRIIVTKIATRAVADHLDDQTQTVIHSTHVCQGPSSPADRVADSPLLASPNQWGQTPFPLSPLSRLAVSRQARDLLDGIITVHRELPVPGAVATPQTLPVPAGRPSPSASYPLQQWRAAVERRHRDVEALASVSTDLAAIDKRAADLDQRIAEMLALATARPDGVVPNASWKNDGPESIQQGDG